MGRVKSLERKCKCKSNGIKTIHCKILTPGIERGYLRVNLCKDNKVKQYQIHRLVATAFLPNENNYPYINHKDENPSNNRVDNLEWCTPKYNANYGTLKERLSEIMKEKYAGGKHPMYGKCHTEEAKKKMSERKNKPVICITTGEIFKSVKEASEITGINLNNISECCRGKRKTAGKREWKFLEKESEE